MAKYVYDFAEGSKQIVDLLGGKGANPRQKDEPGPLSLG